MNLLPRSLREVIICFLLSIVYIVAGKLGLQLAFLNESATVVWPPTGIAIASFLLFGFRIWPAIFIGAFITNITTNGAIPTSFGIALGNTLEGVMAAYFVNKFAHGKDAFYRVEDFLKFIVFAALISTAVSADIGVVSLILGGFAQWSEFTSVWITWWLGDMSGALIVTPLIMFWTNKSALMWGKKKIIEAVLLLALLIIQGLIVFGKYSLGYPLEFLCLPIIVWIAFRLGMRATVSAIVVLSSIAIHGTLNGYGPFAMPSSNESLILLQVFMDIIAASAIMLALAVLENKRSSERYQRVLDNMIEGFQIVSFDWTFLYVNDSVVRQGRSTREELVGHTMMEKYPGIEKTELFKHLERCMKLRVAHQMESEFQFPDGGRGWFDIRIEPIPEGIFILSLDATERKLQQEELKRIASIVESSNDAIIGKSLDGVITSWNKGAEDLYGFTGEEVIGKSNTVLIPEEHRNEWEEIRKRILNEEIIRNFETVRIAKDGRKIDVSITFSPIKDANGITTGTSAIVRDISERKRIDEMKNEFISLASHQLKTPLTSISWYTELLLRESHPLEPEKQKKYLYEVSHASKRMIALINALLNVSRIEMGTFLISPIESSIVNLVEETIDELKVQMSAKKIDFRKEFEEGLPSISIDPHLIKIVVTNLLSNAIKYSKDGGRVTVFIEKDEQNIRIKVVDEGIGIPKLQQDKLFDKFFRADNAKAMNTDGSGLGLYIVKSIIENAGGVLTFESELNKGSTFCASFPLVGMSKKAGTRQLH